MTFSRPYSPQLVVLRFKSIPVPLTVPHFGTGGRGRGGGSGTNSSPASWITEQATGPRSQKSNPVKGPQAPVPAVWSSTVEEHARGGGVPSSASSCASLPRVNHEMGTRGSFKTSCGDVLRLRLSSKRPGRGVAKEQEASQGVPSTCLTWASL